MAWFSIAWVVRCPQDDEAPKLLARFKVNMMDTLAVFKAVRECTSFIPHLYITYISPHSTSVLLTHSAHIPLPSLIYVHKSCHTPHLIPQVSKEDFKDVIGLLPENTPLPASDKMTYLLARLEVRCH